MGQIRDLRMDNAKAVLIMFVVMGHFLLPIKGNTKVCTSIFFLIYTFHMVAFTFLSGIFAQGMYRERDKRKVFNFKQWSKILWLYVIYEIITFFSEIPAYGRAAGHPDFLRENGAPWYLMALLIWYLFIPLFSYVKDRYISIVKGFRIPLCLPLFVGIVVFSLATGYLTGIEYFLSLDRVTAFAPCFFAGYFLGPKGIKSFLRGKVSIILSVLGVLSAAVILLHTFDVLYPYRNVVYGIWYEKMHLDNFAVNFPNALYIAPWILRLIWYIMAGCMTVLLLVLMPTRRIPVLTDIGQRTLQIYILHRPVRDLMLAAGVITSVDPDNMVQLFLLCVFALVLTVFLSSGIFTALLNVLLFPFRNGNLS